jgi:hypothetical protein
MRIKDSGRHDPVVVKGISLFLGFCRSRRTLVVVLGLGLFAGAFFTMGALSAHSGIFGRVLAPFFSSNYRVAVNYARGFMSRPERIAIDIKHKDFQKLAYLRESALREGKIVTREDSYVPAEIRVSGKMIKARVRLKGDAVDHLLGDKWSLRIKIKGEDTLFGMCEFSLQDPARSGFINEWILHQLYAYEDLISLRYKFVEVSINGKNKGIYALEESFAKELIESNRRREGPILKFDEGRLWDGSDANSGTVASRADIFFSSDIDLFNPNKTLASEVLRRDYQVARRLLSDFRSGRARPADVFDLERLARLYALANLANAGHGLLWKNVRYYYNPVTARLEAIGYNSYGDYARAERIKGLLWRGSYPHPWYVAEYHDLFFADDLFVKRYMENLDRISRQPYLDDFFQSIATQLQENLSHIYRDYPAFIFHREDFYANQAFIRGMLDPVIPVKAARVRYEGRENKTKYFVANTGFLPVEPLSLHVAGEAKYFSLRSVSLPGKSPAKPLKYYEINFCDPGEAAKAPTEKELVLSYRLVGLERLFRAEVEDISAALSGLLFDDPESAGEKLDNKMLALDRQKGEIRVRPGSWQLHRDLVFPGGYRVVCPAGVSFSLSNHAKIISYSPLTFAGTEAKPIIVRAGDATGQGLVVLNAGPRSSLRHVVFDGLAPPARKGWQLTGAVTFYESPVDISYCTFESIKAEDALNIVRTTFTISDSSFKGAFSDALDLDFTGGEVRDSFLIKSGNDAVDVSGSNVELKNIFIDGAGDKGLSAGENCRMDVSGVKVKNAEIAVASKDKSEINIRGAEISNSRIGLTVYRKKPGFDFASLVAAAIKMDGVDIPYLVEKGSRLIVDGARIEPNRDKVKSMLYGVEYGRKSK